MGWFSQKIRVKFIDDANDQTIGLVDLSHRRLPKTFELDSVFHFGDQEWAVVAADSLTRAEYRKKGELTLRLRRIAQVDPAEVLHTLPTICNVEPPIGQQPASEDDLVIHGDDWRQLELVADEHAQDVTREIDAIRTIHEGHAVDAGWSELHVRTTPDPPIPGTFTVADVQETLGSSAIRRGLSYYDSGTLVDGGFSVRAADGLTVYGYAPDERVAVLALLDDPPDTPPTASIAGLVRLAEAYRLCLVRWARCQYVPPAADSFHAVIMLEDH